MGAGGSKVPRAMSPPAGPHSSVLTLLSLSERGGLDLQGGLLALGR